jgi:hypothetical protein
MKCKGSVNSWQVYHADMAVRAPETNRARARKKSLPHFGMNRQRTYRALKRVAVVLLLGILGGCMLRQFEHSQVYYPQRQLEASPDELRRPFEDVRFTTSDGVQLHGWFFPANVSSPRVRLAFLICHGNAGNISHRLGLCAGLLETGASVLVFDYRGYGQSEGRPGEAGTYLDAQAALAWLGQKGIRPEHVIVFGESLGGGVASELALREKVGGVALQSTFTSIPDIGAELFPWLPVRLISTIKYDTHAKLPRVKVPVLVMHSRGDELIRYHHAEKNFAAANEPKFLAELQGSHNDAAWENEEFREAIEKLLGAVTKGTQATSPQPPQPARGTAADE